MFVFIKDYFRTEAASSAVLAVMAVLAMVAANSPLSEMYQQMHLPVMVMLVNDGLMALFFLVIGIELKREMVEGELSTYGQAILPMAGAIGGVVCPAVIYTIFNHNDAQMMRGWAVPMATDIAFALGVIGFFGHRLPIGLRIFLMALAVIDDVMAIGVIAVFYTESISLQALGMAAGIVLLLGVYNRKVALMPPFLLAGAALWIALHESGVHATLAGVLLGLLMPLDKGKRVLHMLHGPVAFGVVPLFVFANSGIGFEGVGIDTLLHPLGMGIVLGLFAGKQLGIFAVVWGMVMLGFAKLPVGVSWGQMYGVCMLAGIGFTMSLFIGTLAFAGPDVMETVRLGVIVASLASAVFGGIMLALTMAAKEKE